MRGAGGNRILGTPNTGVIGQLPGGMTHEELENRQSLEFDLVMAQQIQSSLIMSADLIKSCSENPAFAKMPDREKIGKQAMLLHADFAVMQIAMLESVRKKMKDVRPLSDRKDLKLRDVRDALSEQDILAYDKEVEDIEGKE